MTEETSGLFSFAAKHAKNIGIVVCTAMSHIEDTMTGNWLMRSSLQYTKQIYEKNKEPLSVCYNNALDVLPDNVEYIYFIHDDIHVVCPEQFMLIRPWQYFDVWGVAGCKNPVIRFPSLWNVMSKDHRGFAGHMTPSKQTIMSGFGPSPDFVDMIDGVLMAVNRSKLPANVRFAAPGFHHYDLDFSMQVKKAGLKLGVFPFPIYHNSHGLKSLDDVQWNISDQWFREKWGPKDYSRIGEYNWS